MNTKDIITNKLSEAFSPESLDVSDESHLHEGHAGHRPGGETHFRVYIVSVAFEGGRSGILPARAGTSRDSSDPCSSMWARSWSSGA